MKKKTRPRSPSQRPAGRSLLAALAGALMLAGCAATSPPGGGQATAEAARNIARLPSLPPLPALPGAPASAEVAAPQALDPLRPGERIDFEAASAQSDLWQRVRRGFAMPDLDSHLVRDREQWYSSRPDYVGRMTGRASRYLFHIVEEVERRGLPTELALLPFVESAFNPQAMSTAKASGMWQFIPSTGRDYLLRQNMFRDDRRDVLASTRAALDYLERLHGMFGDWHLALAAYNWGEGSVQRAIARNERAGLPTDYQSLRMPDETRLYVPKLQAVKNIVARPESFGLELTPVANHPYFVSVPINRDIDVELAARLAGISTDEFRTLNPQMKKPVILAAGTPQLLLPYDNANQFVKRLQLHTGPLASWTAWVAPRTLSPADAAREVGITEEELRELNGIPFRMLVRAGSTLLVPRSAEASAEDVAGHVADNAMMALTPEMVAAVRRSPPRAVAATRREPAPPAAARTVAEHRTPRHGVPVVLAATPQPPRGKGAAAAGTAAATRIARAERREASARPVAQGSAPRAAPAAPTAGRLAAAAPSPAPARVARTEAAVRMADAGGKAAARGGATAARPAKAAPAGNAPPHRVRVALGH